MKKNFVLLLLFFAGVVPSFATYATFKTGTSSVSFFGAPYVMEWEAQIDTSSPSTMFVQVRVRVTHTNITDERLLELGNLAYALGFSYQLARSWPYSGPDIKKVGAFGEAGYKDLRQSDGWYVYPPTQYQAGDVISFYFWSRYKANYGVGGTWVSLPLQALTSFPVPGSATVYYVTFSLPANDSEHRRDYFATQGGQTVGTTFQSAGDFIRDWKVGPLTSNAPVSLSVVTGGRTGWDAVNGLIIPTSETLSSVVDPGTVPTVGVGSTGGNSGPVDNVPGVVTTPAPTLSNPTSGGGGLVNVGATNTTATGATTGDISVLTAAVSTGANGVISNATSNANGVIGAVNRSITALDEINATLAANAAGGGSGTDMGPTNALLGTANGHLGAIKDAIAAQKTDRAAEITAATTAATSFGAGYSGAVSGEISSAQGNGEALANSFVSSPFASAGVSLAGQTVLPADDGFASSSLVVDLAGTSVGGSIDGGNLDLNPLTSPQLGHLIGEGTAGKLASWIKAFILWASVVQFLVWVFGKVKENIVEMFTVPQMALPGSTQLVARSSVVGNSVGVPIAAGLYVLQRTALITLLLSMPVLWVAVVFDTSGSSSLATAAATAASTTTSGTFNSYLLHALSFAYAFCPLATLVTIAVNRLLVNISAITQFMISSVVMRTVSV